MNLLVMSLAGSILIIYIWLLRAIFLHKLPKTAFFVLWEIAALRLLLPFSIPVPSIFSALTASYGEPSVPGTATTAQPDLSSIPVPNTSVNVISSDKMFSGLLWIWAIGTITFAIWFSFVYLRNMQTFRASLPDTTQYIQQWLVDHPCHRPLEVRISDHITSPLTYGIFRPVILLPKGMDVAADETLQVVLTHEYVHIRRFDGLAKLCFAAVLCLYWWNPLVWVLYILANRDMELSCDAAVIRTLGTSHRSSYALTLISLEEAQSKDLSFQNHFSKNAITERIEEIMKCKKSTFIAIMLAVILVLSSLLFWAGLPYSPRKAAEALEKSIHYADGTLSFQIPKRYKEAKDWNIHISGQQSFPDGMSMSVHHFEEINETHTWEKGKVYTIEIQNQGYEDLIMDIFLPGNVEKTIDLLSYVTE